MTSEEYFQLIDDNKHSLIRLIDKYHPLTQNRESFYEMPITARMAEKACEQIRKEIIAKAVDQSLKNPVLTFLNSVMNKNIGGIVTILNETWFGMPESSAIHSEPGFYVLCDLCSDFPDDIEFEE